MTPACKRDRCNSGRSCCPTPEACQTAVGLPPLFAWFRREWIARARLCRWFITYRKCGFRPARALVLAWKTTNPIRSQK